MVSLLPPSLAATAAAPLLLSLLSLLSLAALPAPASAQLNELARRAGKKYFGTATDNGELSNTTYFSILTDTREFGQLTPANGMKWQFVEPELGVFNFTEGAVVADLARAEGQLLRCHNLVWHQQLAPFVTDDAWDAANLTAMLREHVFREASHWAGQCYAWDVVNEALNDDGTYGSDVFLDVLGPDYIKIAFETAALADPGARLYYNDFNIEFPGPKQAAVVELVKTLQAAGVRIDGVGLQSHFIAGETPSIDEQIAAMRSYTALGLEVAQTEVDVRLQLPATEANLAQQKADYRTTVGACMQVEECVGVTVWDFYDPFSWVPGTFAGFGDADLWFANFSKHPAYYGVVEALVNETCSKKASRKKARREAEGKSRPLFE